MIILCGVSATAVAKSFELFVFSEYIHFLSLGTDWGDYFKGCIWVVGNGAPRHWGAWREKEGLFFTFPFSVRGTVYLVSKQAEKDSKL